MHASAHALAVERSLIELSYEPILAWRIDAGVTLWNAGCERLYGYSRAEALDRSSHELLQTVHPVPLQEIVTALHSQGYWSGELRHRTRDGREVVVESRQQLIETDGVPLVLETNRDITDRCRAETLRTVLAAVVESSDDAIISTDLDGIVTSWNRAAERTFGYAAAESLGRSIRMIIPAERYEEEAAVLSRIRRGQIVDPIETVRRRKNGTDVPVSISASPIRDAFGTLIGASKVARDITERKRAAERAAFLAEATALLVTSLDYESTVAAVAHLSVPAIADWAAIDLCGRDGYVERVATAHANPARLDLARQFHGRFEAPCAVARTGTPLLVSLVSEETIATWTRGDDEHASLARSLGTVSCLCVPLMAHGRTFGALTLATAESRRQYGDEDLKFAQDVAYRLALAIDNAQAYREAQLANRLKDEFLATLSHELRTPLNAIVGYSRLLRLQTIAPEQRPHAIATVERNASALTRIVEDVLDVSRIIAGKVRLEIRPVDLPALVKNAIDTMMPAAAAKRVSILTFADPNVESIAADRDRLLQVLWNLLSNAVKFTPEGGTIRLSVESRDAHAEIAIEDTGIGIRPSFLPHIFERFRQADATAAGGRAGLGLGLAIVQHLVQLHGGTVQAISEGEGRGATFIVRLPLKLTAAERPKERRQRADDATVLPLPAGALTGIRVLAVDDDPDSLDLVEGILASVGATVLAARSGLESLEAIAQFQPDVLIADIRMPDMDGRELLRRVRQSPDPSIRDVPAAVLTAHARSEDRVASLQSGFQMHLLKPVDPAELVAATAALGRAAKVDPHAAGS